MVRSENIKRDSRTTNNLAGTLSVNSRWNHKTEEKSSSFSKGQTQRTRLPPLWGLGRVRCTQPYPCLCREAVSGKSSSFSPNHKSKLRPRIADERESLQYFLDNSSNGLPKFRRNDSFVAERNVSNLTTENSNTANPSIDSKVFQQRSYEAGMLNKVKCSTISSTINCNESTAGPSKGGFFSADKMAMFYSSKSTGSSQSLPCASSSSCICSNIESCLHSTSKNCPSVSNDPQCSMLNKKEDCAKKRKHESSFPNYMDSKQVAQSSISTCEEVTEGVHNSDLSDRMRSDSVESVTSSACGHLDNKKHKGLQMESYNYESSTGCLSHEHKHLPYEEKQSVLCDIPSSIDIKDSPHSSDYSTIVASSRKIYETSQNRDGSDEMEDMFLEKDEHVLEIRSLLDKNETSSSYILSSGRTTQETAEVSSNTIPTTIDKDFEDYFSTLML